MTLVLDGRKLLVRRGGELVEPGGQLRIDFDALAEDTQPEPPATILSPAQFLSRQAAVAGRDARAVRRLGGRAWTKRATCRMAAEMYRAALAAGGPQPELCFQLAEALYRAGDLAAARERYFVAIELDENYVEARANLGCVLLDLGEKELAVAAFEGALRSHEAYADVHYHLARTLDELGPRRRSRGPLVAVSGAGPRQPLGRRSPRAAVVTSATAGTIRRGILPGRRISSEPTI